MNTIKELTQQEKYNNMLKRKNKEIKNLKEDFKRHIDRINVLTNRIDKAIEHIEKHHPRYKEVLWDDGWYYKDIDELLDILKGSDKE